ncbi:cytochrome c [uncultured Albimonas sp.]|uniref:c-type cytochrome n=1 Tax=uncultured Albimonas sp. TaxID=1331701 RepID=UPI0030EC4E2C|tara:strand:+ start:352 stop:825 length:474 start_codon:yes stop_codon:yes gene_type:complete
MPRKSFVIASAAVAALAAASLGLAHAADVEPKIDDPVSLRMNLMKDAGAAVGIMAAIAKGEAEFEPRAVKGALLTLNAVALGFPAQFPQGATSETSEAAPAIWDDAAGFQETAAKFIADTQQAKSMPMTNADEMKAALGLVAQNCKACHENYRVKKN